MTGMTEETKPPEDCTAIQDEYEELLDDYDDLQSERDAYLATMIVFIILFVIEAGLCIYFFMKSRN